MKKRGFLIINNFNVFHLFFNFIKTLLVYLIATVFALWLNAADVMNDNIFGVYMLAVAIISFLTEGYIWGILASIGGVIGVNFFFTFPYFALNFRIAGYPVTFTLMLIMAILASFLTTKVKTAAIISAEGKKRAETLNEMSNALLTADNLDSITEMAAKYLQKANQCSVILYIGTPKNPEKMVLKVIEEADKYIFQSVLEKEIASFSYENGSPSGADIKKQDTNCKGTYLPILMQGKKYGVVGFLFDASKMIMEDTYSFIHVMISQLILALENLKMTEQTQKIILETEKEKMRSNLLRAISHDLRTPLTGIIGSASTLLENAEWMTTDVSKKMLTDIQQDAEWLIQMVENLLSITRISDGIATLKKQNEIVEEIVGEAVERIRKRFPNAIVNVKVPDEILIVPMDATLIEQVLINLIENAIRHSGTTLPISLTVSRKAYGSCFTVSDMGKGIDPDSIPNIFDGITNKRASDSSRGIGIGLSICRSIILAHGGQIFAENNANGGTSFTFFLPMKGEDVYVE